jgi:hypothetical protein
MVTAVVAVLDIALADKGPARRLKAKVIDVAAE